MFYLFQKKKLERLKTEQKFISTSFIDNEKYFKKLY